MCDDKVLDCHHGMINYNILNKCVMTKTPIENIENKIKIFRIIRLHMIFEKWQINFNLSNIRQLDNILPENKVILLLCVCMKEKKKILKSLQIGKRLKLWCSLFQCEKGEFLEQTFSHGPFKI